MDDVATFRSAVREWLDDHDLTPPSQAYAVAGRGIGSAQPRAGALYDAGWMRYGWPEAVGGLGGPALLRAVLGEEVATRDLAEPGIYSMVEVLAPTMISYAPAGARRGDGAAAAERRGALVPGVLRAGLGQRPRVAVHPAAVQRVTAGW